MTAVDNDIVVEQQAAPREKHGLWARVLSEFAGSLLICLAIYLMCSFGTVFYSTNMAFIALGTGVVYATMTAIFGKISGAQFNPAITVAAMLTSKTRVLDGILYIVAQLVGCICAGGLFKLIIPTSSSITAGQWFNLAVNGFDQGSVLYTSLSSLGLTFNVTVAIVVELAASIIVVAAAMQTMKRDGKPEKQHTLVMGLAYATGVAMAFPVTGASINPIRATGIAIFGQNEGLTQEPLQQLWVFWVCSILGAAIVALVIIVAQLISAHADSDVLVETDPAAAAMEDAEDAEGGAYLEQSNSDTTFEDQPLTGAEANALEAQESNGEEE
ncbi:MIP/aquaporin family protein [Bifidobacterium choloepi]|uniref:Glycerol transporter n=1 Tax=Bifidobacterium choloepi TaxID=2614131 RepID=A0A6I5MY53_9BIFI|nr:aquaporin [Bifidobacterium choloepi]NEG69116.1 glycerol transporter [Bifidobacterium choloepi]